MTKTLEENGKVYTVDEETGLVVEAKAVDNSPLGLKERVEVNGNPGQVVSKITSVYGPVIGVRFDSGETGEFLAEQVKRSTVEAIRYDTPIDQVKADWNRYQELPSYTLEQVETKARLARSLNVTAKALVTDRRTALSDVVLLDTIVITTGTDLLDAKDQIERLSVGDAYGDNLPQYGLPSEVIATSDYSREDASWLSLAADEVSDEQNDFNWDNHLAAEALKATASLTAEQLESDDFMDAVAGYREDAMPHGFNDSLRGTFRELLESARQDAIAQREATKMARTAKIEEELADFQDEQLFL